MISGWKNREELDDFFRSDVFSVLSGALRNLCQETEFTLDTVEERTGGLEAVKSAVALLGTVKEEVQ
jgi:hypothetical protein